VLPVRDPAPEDGGTRDCSGQASAAFKREALSRLHKAGNETLTDWTQVQLDLTIQINALESD
jgi:hypothetical protein